MCFRLSYSLAEKSTRVLFRLIFCGLILILSVQCRKGPSEAVWTTFNGEDGLAENQVTDITIEPGGSIWFATAQRGVTRLSFE